MWETRLAQAAMAREAPNVSLASETNSSICPKGVSSASSKQLMKNEQNQVLREKKFARSTESHTVPLHQASS